MSHQPPPNSCCSARCRRENSSLLAALGGALSLACLVSAIMTDMWTYTEEGILAPGLSRAAKKQNIDGSIPEHSSAVTIGGRSENQQLLKISFTVGLWRVCPYVIDDENSESINGGSPIVGCTSVGYGHLWNDISWKQLGLWAPVENTPSFISRMRISTFFAILSVAVLIVSTLLAMIGHCAKGQKMLLASGLYALAGLILGCGLIVYVCVLSDEFGPRRPRERETSSKTFTQTHFSYHTFQNGNNLVVTAQYSYGWSFFLAILGFLGAELSAVLCLTAFLNRFTSEDEFLKMIPGMSRRMAEHRGGLLRELDQHRASLEAPLLKTGNGGGGSFGHHILTSDDTLYALDTARGGMVASQSVTSVIGLTHLNGGGSRIDVEKDEMSVEICQAEHKSPVSSRMQHHQQQKVPPQQRQSFIYNNSPPSHSSSTTLPRQMEKRSNHHHIHHYHQNAFQQHQHQQQQQQAVVQSQQQQRHLVVTTNGLGDDSEMDRTSFMNGDDDDDNEMEDMNDSRSVHQHHNNLMKMVVPPPPRLDFVLPEGVPPPPSSTASFLPSMATMPRGAMCSVNGGIISSGNGTCGRKKKSVTIGTFTTVETFAATPVDESV